MGKLKASVYGLLNFSRSYTKDYYKILDLKNDCTSKDIKESFVKLSKELHPDRQPNNPSSHAKFILVNEAYNVLIKPESRRAYDAEISSPKIRFPQAGSTPPGWSDNTIWEWRDRSKDKYYEGKPYYGIKGMKRISNFSIALGCTIFMIIGTALQLYSIKLGRGIETEKSKVTQQKNTEFYLQTREKAKILGTAEQLKILNEKSQRGS